MARDLRIYREKLLVSGETKDKFLHVAKDMGVEPHEAFNRLIHRGYHLWPDGTTKAGPLAAAAVVVVVVSDTVTA